MNKNEEDRERVLIYLGLDRNDSVLQKEAFNGEGMENLLSQKIREAVMNELKKCSTNMMDDLAVWTEGRKIYLKFAGYSPEQIEARLKEDDEKIDDFIKNR